MVVNIFVLKVNTHVNNYQLYNFKGSSSLRFSLQRNMKTESETRSATSFTFAWNFISPKYNAENGKGCAFFSEARDGLVNTSKHYCVVSF